MPRLQINQGDCGSDAATRYMVNYTFEIDPQAIDTDCVVRNKDTLFATLATMADRVYGLDAPAVEESLVQREALGTTGFGLGVAIPHARVDHLVRPVGLFVSPSRPINYDSVDDLPVDLVFCLLSPASAGAVHLKALAELSRMLRDPKLVANLRGASDADSIYAVIEAYDARSAA